MKKLLILFIFLSGVSFANNAPLFGIVKGVASNDALNIRAKPNYKSKKITSLPNGAYVGISRCKYIGHSKWCKIFHLTQRDYDGFGDNAHSGWVNAKFLKFSNRGYVIVNNKASCDYALRCNGNKCKVITDYSADKNGNTISLKSSWIDRSKLKASTSFGAIGKDGEGYCVSGNHIEEYLSKHKNHKGSKLYVKVPSYLHKKVLSNGSVAITKTMPLKHYSGCDERDNPPLLYRYSQIDLKITPYNSFANALKKISVSKKDLTKGRYFGLKGYKFVAGAEGCGVEYYIFQKHGKVILLENNFDYNPPRLPNGRIGHYKKLGNENRVIRNIVRSIK